MPLLCTVLQECTGRWYSVATSPHSEGDGCQGQARRSVMPFGFDLYCTSCWHWPTRNICCEYHCAALVCGQERKNRRRTRNPVLCFESSSVVVFPFQQAPKGDEMSICLCFPVIFWNGLHWSVHSSFVSGFLFCYWMCSKFFSLHRLPVLFFLFSFVVWTQVTVIILLGKFKGFVSLLDFLGPCGTGWKSMVLEKTV